MVTTAYMVIAIRIEEHDLVAMLGKAYVEYRKHVPALIPFTKIGVKGDADGKMTAVSDKK